MDDQPSLFNSCKEAVIAAKLRVCIVSPLFNPAIGGPGRQAFIMARHLGKKGIDISVIARRLSGVKNETADVGVYYVPTISPHVHNLSEFSMKNLLISLSFSFGAMMKLFRLRKCFEIVQFNGASLPLLVSLPLLKLLGKEVVAQTTGGRGGKEAGGLDGFFLKPLIVAIFRHADRFIAISEDIEKRLLKEGFVRERVTKIPNGVDTDVFCHMNVTEQELFRNKFGLKGKKVFLCSGRLVKGKGLELLLKAMVDVVKFNKDVMLVLIGDGELEDRLKDMVRVLMLENFVRFDGLVENVHEYLNASDIFIFPSLSEGMPNSLLEAMACGLPVIASKIGGVVDVVEDGKSGILVEPGDISGLSTAMIRLLKDAELRQRLGAEARRRIVEGFSIDRIADEYIKLYEGL